MSNDFSSGMFSFKYRQTVFLQLYIPLILSMQTSQVYFSLENSRTKVLDILQKNRSKSNLTEESSNHVINYEIDYAAEESDLKSKEHLYIQALNRGRPRGLPKIQSLPNVGYLPTIFEKLPHPITAAILRSYMDQESVIMEEKQNIPIKSTCLELNAYKVEEKSICMQLQVNITEESFDRRT